jgi:hypothetical protein
MESFDSAEQAASTLMGALYAIRSRFPPDKYPEVWEQIPGAQTALHGIQKAITKSRDSVSKKS